MNDRIYIHKGKNLFIQCTAKKVYTKKKRNKEKCFCNICHILYVIVTQVTFPHKHTSENDLTFPWGLSWQEKEEKKERKEKKSLKLLYFPTCKKNTDFTFQLIFYGKKGNIMWNWFSFTGTMFFFFLYRFR